MENSNQKLLRLNLWLCLIFSCQLVFSQSKTAAAYIVTDHFIASGYMGDRVKFVKNCTKDPLSGDNCIEVSYTASNKLWGGLFFQNLDKNWCNKPGVNLSGKGYTKLTFWAKGSTGKEEIKFLIGQDCGDSVNKKKLIRLDKSWRQYSVSLTDDELKNVAGIFGFSVDSKAHAGPVTFYLDDIKVE